MSQPANDGRYYWSVNAAAPIGPPITFVGDLTLLIGSMSLGWQITQAAADGSAPYITYSTNGGATFTTVNIGSANTPQAGINEAGQINVPLAGATGIIVNVGSTGGTVTAGALPCIVAIALNRNNNETLTWDAPNPFNPAMYNGAFADNGGVDVDTMINLRTRMLIDLGFASQSANPPAGMKLYCNNALVGAQNFLHRKFTSLRQRRWFRWKLAPGQRFYSMLDNDEDILAGLHIDPNKPIEYVAVQDTRNVWYELIEGIPPSLYTMIDKPWRPARYEIRSALEIYPAPDQTYWLWIRGNYYLGAFVVDTDKTTIDSEAVYLWALAKAKNHYGQADADSIAQQAKDYTGRLVAATHKTARYIPGVKATPPAVRPALITADGLIS